MDEATFWKIIDKTRSGVRSTADFDRALAHELRALEPDKLPGFRDL